MKRITNASRFMKAAAAAALLAGITAAHAGGSIFEVAKSGTAEELEQLLATNRALINARSELGSTPLHVAATNPSPDVARLLLSKGAEVDARDNNGATPLHLAAYAGKPETVKLLLASGADGHARDFRNNTPRDYADRAMNKQVKAILVLWMLSNPPKTTKR